MDAYENSSVVDLPSDNSNLPDEFKERPYIVVYLASALTGREQEQTTDNKIRKIIRDAFSKSTFRKEHLVLNYKVYDPAEPEHTPPGTSHSPEEVYRIDFSSLVKADIALFYINAPSYGVGIERQIAAMACVPGNIVYPISEVVSRMFSGTFSGSVFTASFESMGELSLTLGNQIAKHGEEFFERTLHRRRIINSLKDIRFPKFIFKRRISLGVKIEELVKKTGIQAFW